jgi:hypothetical protein
MIITFDPKVGTTAPSTDATYINFLRCVTAACTAAAGTTTLTVNPYTASNTIDTSKNCIVSIDANTEAGGWTTSASHSVPSSGNNTATTWTAVNINGVYTANYKADFYNASGKSAVPYKKLSFHIPVTSSRDLANNVSTGYPSNWPSFPVVMSTFGHSTTTDWTDTNFVAISSSGFAANTTSNTPFKDIGTSVTSYYVPTSNPWFMNMAQGTVKYKIAVTSNYCIIWEVGAGQSYSAGYTTAIAAGDPVTQSYTPRCGSIIYHGLRETQPWENAYNDNPPWVSWGYVQVISPRTSVTSYRYYAANNVAAWMRGIDQSTNLTATPVMKSVQNYLTSGGSTAYGNFSANGNKPSATAELETPIFRPRAMDGADYGSTTAVINPPQSDPITGLQVPGAYPIIIRSGIPTHFNPGGACRGIYKSLSLDWATMKNYWTAENQTFSINNDLYLPVVMGNDMWLIRAA